MKKFLYYFIFLYQISNNGSLIELSKKEITTITGLAVLGHILYKVFYLDRTEIFNSLIKFSHFKSLPSYFSENKKAIAINSGTLLLALFVKHSFNKSKKNNNTKKPIIKPDAENVKPPITNSPNQPIIYFKTGDEDNRKITEEIVLQNEEPETSIQSIFKKLKDLEETKYIKLILEYHIENTLTRETMITNFNNFIEIQKNRSELKTELIKLLKFDTEEEKDNKNIIMEIDYEADKSLECIAKEFKKDCMDNDDYNNNYIKALLKNFFIESLMKYIKLLNFLIAHPKLKEYIENIYTNESIKIANDTFKKVNENKEIQSNEIKNLFLELRKKEKELEILYSDFSIAEKNTLNTLENIKEYSEKIIKNQEERFQIKETINKLLENNLIQPNIDKIKEICDKLLKDPQYSQRHKNKLIKQLTEKRTAANNQIVKNILYDIIEESLSNKISETGMSCSFDYKDDYLKKYNHYYSLKETIDSFKDATYMEKDKNQLIKITYEYILKFRIKYKFFLQYLTYIVKNLNHWFSLNDDPILSGEDICDYKEWRETSEKKNNEEIEKLNKMSVKIQ